MPNKREQLVERLRDKEYRDTLVGAEISNGIPFQIKAMQTERGWTQEQLAAAGGMKQESIARWVKPDYANYSLKTLRRLASAFDVALVVRFVPFSEFAKSIVHRTYADLAVPEFAEDKALYEEKSDSTAPRAFYADHTWEQLPLSFSLLTGGKVLDFWTRPSSRPQEDRSIKWFDAVKSSLPSRSLLKI